MSFNMSQGSQGNLMMQQQPGGQFRAFDGQNGHQRRNSAPQIYSVGFLIVFFESRVVLMDLGDIFRCGCV